MTVHIDTSALVDALTGPRRSLEILIGLAQDGHRLTISAISGDLVVYTDFSGVDADVWYTDLSTGLPHPVSTAPAISN